MQIYTDGDFAADTANDAELAEPAEPKTLCVFSGFCVDVVGWQGKRDGTTTQRVTQGLNCSSFCSLAATDSASRLVPNLPTRTR